MFDTQEIRLSQREPQEEIVTCPKCESYLVEFQGNFTYTCQDCLNTFSISPMADDSNIPF